MKKIKQKLSRGAVSALALLALFLLGTASAKSENLEFGKEYKQTWDGSNGSYPYMTRYEFTPDKDGTLKINFASGFNLSVGSANGADSYGLYELIGSDENPISATEQNGEYMTTWLGTGLYINVTEAIWNIQANHKYFVWFPYYESTFIASFDGGNTGEGPTDPPTENKVDDLVIPSYNVTASSNDGYKFTADKTGKLKITFTAPPNKNILYANYSDGNFSNNITPVDGTLFYLEEQVWNVTQGTTYYIDTDNLVGSFSIEIIEDGGNTGGDEGNFELETLFQISSGFSVKGLYKPNQNGKLIVKMFFGLELNPTDNSVVFSDPNYSNPLKPTLIEGLQNYELVAGNTYYIKAAMSNSSPGDGQPFTYEYSIYFSFEGTGGPSEPEPIIEELPVPYSFGYITPLLYSYTPNQDGYLWVQYSEGMARNLLYYDKDLVSNVPLASGTQLYDSSHKWEVIKGNTYYFDASELLALQLSITFENGTGGIDPGPGGDDKDVLPVNQAPLMLDGTNHTTKYYYTPSKDGELTLNVEGGPLNTQEAENKFTTFLFSEDGTEVPFSSKIVDYPDFLITGATWSLKAGITYYFVPGYNDAKTLYFTFPEDILVNIGDFNQNPILWSKEGNDFQGIISYPEGEEIDLKVTVEPVGEWANIQEPDEWSEGMHMPSWIWNLKESMKNNNQIIDGYYKEPVVSKPEQEPDGRVNFNVFFGCSGQYKITVTATNENVVFEGDQEQIINVYPNLRNSYTLKSNVDGKEYESSLVINEMNINDHEDGNLQMDYVKDENGNLFTGKYDKDGNLIYANEKSDLSKSVIFVRGLFFTNADDGIYYKYDEMPTSPKMRAAAAEVDDISEYNKVTDGNMDLSEITRSSNHTITFRIVKNGVDTGDGVASPADYQVALNFTTNVPTAVEGIEAPEDGEAVYYNLQGVKVANPANGIYIKVRGGKATKVLVK